MITGHGPVPLYQTLTFAIEDETGIGHARRASHLFCTELGVSTVIADKTSLIVTELAANIFRHAGRGQLLAQYSNRGIEVIALDNGPGIANVTLSMKDGYSTAGTAGNGLGAVQRAASHFDILSSPGKGTIVLARILDAPSPSPVLTGRICVAKPGETITGDAWSVRQAGDHTAITVVDGLGHGPDAAIAASAALRVAGEARPGQSMEEVAGDVHLALRQTRGAAIAFARLDHTAQTIMYLGVGNIAAAILGEKRQNLASHNGTMGAMAPKLRTFTHAWKPGDTLVMHSDGIGTRWQLDDLPGILNRDPVVIAAAVYRGYFRANDDATVLVHRHPEAV